MNIYIETNFLLNFGLHQEGFESVAQIIDAAKTLKLNLLLPAIASVEAISAMQRKHEKRSRVIQGVKEQLAQGERSPDPQRLTSLRTTAGVLSDLNREEATAVQEAIALVLACAEVLPLTANGMAQALEAQRELIVQPVDSVIFASIVEHLNQNPDPDISCFLSSDERLANKVSVPLTARNCKCFSNFDDGWQFVQRSLP